MPTATCCARCAAGLGKLTGPAPGRYTGGFLNHQFSAAVNPAPVQLDVQLGRLRLANPITVASGTFGYAGNGRGGRRWAAWAPSCPRRSPRAPRAGNPPPRTVETAAGMLNSIGLDNDGIELFIQRQLPYLATLGTKIIVSIAGKTREEFVEMAARLDGLPGADALELNISCPNVSGGVDFGTDPAMCEAVVAGVRRACSLPVIAKLTPNVTEHRGHCPGGRSGRGRRPLADQHLPGHGGRLARAGGRCWATAWAG